MQKFKRVYLIVMLVLVGLYAVAGGGLAILSDSSHLEGVIIAESSIYLLVMSLAAYTALGHRWWRVVAISGWGLAGLSVVTMLGYAWISRYSATPGFEALDTPGYRLAMILNEFAGLLCLTAFTMAPRFGVPGRFLQIGTALALCAYYMLAMDRSWSQSGGADELMHWIFAAQIAGSAGVVAVAALRAFASTKVADPLSTVRPLMRVQCPRCMLEQEVRTGESKCARCRLRLTIEVEEPKCPKCGYNLYQLTRPVCPECGQQLSGDVVLADPHDELLAWAKANGAVSARSPGIKPPEPPTNGAATQ